MFMIFFRCSLCSMPSVFRRSSSSRSYKKAPSTAASMKASLYCPRDKVCSHRATSSTDHAETFKASSPGAWPGRRAGLNASPPSLSSKVPPPPPPPRPLFRPISWLACNAPMTVSCAATVRMARIMLSEEKYVMDIDMKPNFIIVSVDCISCAACFFSLIEGPTQPWPNWFSETTNAVEEPCCRATTSVLASCLRRIWASSLCCSSNKSTSLRSSDRSSSSLPCLARSKVDSLPSKEPRACLRSAILDSMAPNSRSRRIFCSRSSTFASSSSTPAASDSILESWCISRSSCETPCSNSLISSKSASTLSSATTLSAVSSETSDWSRVAWSLCSRSI
mmetsp:Transcript_12724/g.42469  ORF Transcript_12724/g.42469 Transcript_12724/m.42469 type:complete len:336 (-) Transcript_12724:2750-3757(-)